MIRTVVFDIGNVLNAHDWDAYAKRRLAILGEEYLGLFPLMHQVFQESGKWRELDRGILSQEECLNLFIEEAPEHADVIRYLDEHTGEHFARAPYAANLIQEVKAEGVQVLYLSNYFRRLIELNPDVLYFMEYMDGGMFSCDVKLIKPDPAIYRAFLEKFQLDASECLFVDDKMENVEGARSVGMNAIQFKGYECTKDEIIQAIRNQNV